MKKVRPFAAAGEILSRACILYTALSLVLYAAGLMFSTFEKEWIPTFGMLLMLLAFTLLFSAVNRFVLGSNLPGILKLLIHYPVTTALFYVIFIVWGGFSGNGSGVLVILIAYTLLYIIAALIRFAVLHVRDAARSSSSSYDSQFEKKN